MTHSHFVSIRLEGEVYGRNKTHVTIVTAVAGLQVRTLSAEVGLHQLFPVWISCYILNKKRISLSQSSNLQCEWLYVRAGVAVAMSTC